MRFPDSGWKRDSLSCTQPEQNQSNFMPFSAGHRYTEEGTQSDGFPRFNNAQQDSSRPESALSTRRPLDQDHFANSNMNFPNSTLKCKSFGCTQLEKNKSNPAPRSAGYKYTEEKEQRDGFCNFDKGKSDILIHKSKGGDCATSPSIHSVSNVKPKTPAKGYMCGFFGGKQTPFKDRKHDTSKDSGDSASRTKFFSPYSVPYTHGLSSTLLSLT